jgi:hypothetical protein
MRLRVHLKRPEPWVVRKQKVSNQWLAPWWAFEWFWEWGDIRDLKGANIFGVKNAPEGFVAYALKRGAIQIESDSH